MSRLAVDSSGYIAFAGGQDGAIGAIRHADEILVPAVVIGELLAAYEHSRQRDTNRERLQEFLAAARVRVATVTDDTAERYAALHAFLRAAGTPIPTNDLWIAASAWEHGAALLTGDAHFSRLPQVLTRGL